MPRKTVEYDVGGGEMEFASMRPRPDAAENPSYRSTTGASRSGGLQ